MYTKYKDFAWINTKIYEINHFEEKFNIKKKKKMTCIITFKNCTDSMINNVICLIMAFWKWKIQIWCKNEF